MSKNQKMNIEELSAEIKQKWEQYLLDKSHPYINGNLYASRSGEPCERYHYYSLLIEGEAFNLDSMQRMDDGNTHERAVISRLREIGYDIILEQQQILINLKDNQEIIGRITGKIDGMIYKNHKRYPFEIKAYSTYTASYIESADDLLKSKYGKGAYYQLQLYLYNFGFKEGLIIIKDKNDGKPRFIPMKLNLDIIDEILLRAENVYKAFKRQSPEGLKRDINYEKCLRCPFITECKPDFTWGDEAGIKFLIETGEIDSLIDELKDIEINLKPQVKRKKEIKALLEGESKKIQGEKQRIPGIFDPIKENNVSTQKYLVIRKISQRDGYTVKPSEVISYKYDKIKKEDKEI